MIINALVHLEAACIKNFDMPDTSKISNLQLSEASGFFYRGHDGKTLLSLIYFIFI
jgi:hypothetical protein